MTLLPNIVFTYYLIFIAKKVNNLANIYKYLTILFFMDIDSKNKMLFEHLLAYARFSVKDLARILKVSKSTVIKRLRFLEDNEYISRYDAIINWQKLPFIKKVYFVKVDEKRKEFESLMILQKPVFSLIALSGLYNFQIWCFFKTERQKREFEALLSSIAKKDITIHELIFPRVTFFDVTVQLHTPKIENKELKVTPIDIAIMKYMAQGHGRDSFYEISRALKLPYDSVHYHGKNILRAGYFLAIIAQPGTNKFTLQTTSLLIQCIDKESAGRLYILLKKTPKVISDALGRDGMVLVHFLSQTHSGYRATLSSIFSLIPRSKIKSTLITHWDKPLLNNRYPLEYLL